MKDKMGNPLSVGCLVAFADMQPAMQPRFYTSMPSPVPIEATIRVGEVVRMEATGVVIDWQDNFVVRSPSNIVKV